MSRVRTQVLLLVLLALLLTLHWVLGPNPEQRSWQWLPEMVDAVPYESFAPSPAFADGKVLQPPPAGTVPRDLPPLHYQATEEDARRAGRELTNPFAPAGFVPDADGQRATVEQGAVEEGAVEEGTMEQIAREQAALERGAAVYATFCEICHGAGGAGDGTVARRGFPAPPSLLADQARNLPDGEMFHILTYGRANMPSYRAQIGREDRWRAILHIRRLQAEAPPEPKSGTTRADGEGG